MKGQYIIIIYTYTYNVQWNSETSYQIMLILLPFLTGVQQESGTRKTLALGLLLFKTLHSMLYSRRYVRGQNTCDVHLVQD